MKRLVYLVSFTATTKKGDYSVIRRGTCEMAVVVDASIVTEHKKKIGEVLESQSSESFVINGYELVREEDTET